MITSIEDFKEQIDYLENHLSVPKFESSQIMNSKLFNEYLSSLEESIESTTLAMRTLEDCGDFLETYLSNMILKYDKEFQDILNSINQNQSLYQDKNYRTNLVNFNQNSVVKDRDGNELPNKNINIRKENDFRAVMPAENKTIYSYDSLKNGILIINKNNFSSIKTRDISEIIVKLKTSLLCNKINLELVNADAIIQINNDPREFKANEYFNPTLVDTLKIKLISKKEETSQILARKSVNNFINNLNSDKLSESKLMKKDVDKKAEIYYRNDVTKYLNHERHKT